MKPREILAVTLTIAVMAAIACVVVGLAMFLFRGGHGDWAIVLLVAFPFVGGAIWPLFFRESREAVEAGHGHARDRASAGGAAGAS